MKKLLLIFAIAFASCQKKDEVKPTVNTSHTLDVTPTNYNTSISINNAVQYSTQGAQQFTVKTGDVIYIYAISPQFYPIALFSVKDNGVLLFQATQQNNSFTYTVK